MASIACTINPQIQMNDELIKKHFYRKHGAGAYYGQ
jgi:L-ribulose-5-phosphate 4-epimerase